MEIRNMINSFRQQIHNSQIVLILLAFTSNTGCSVGMAMSGKPAPDLGMVQVGASRGEIELTLGPPVKIVTLDDGNRMDVYEYEIGNESSAGRAVGHAVMDILTLGIWEIIGTPIEAFQGDKHVLNIIYDKEERVLSINRSIIKSTKEKE